MSEGSGLKVYFTLSKPSTIFPKSLKAFFQIEQPVSGHLKAHSICHLNYLIKARAHNEILEQDHSPKILNPFHL